jgi:sn-glycerol 3-phosphate transport system permease protein
MTTEALRPEAVGPLRATRRRGVQSEVLVGHLVTILVVTLMLVPLLWMLSTAFKRPDQIFGGTFNLLPLPPTLDNFAFALGRVPLGRYLLNTLAVAVAQTVLQLLAGILAAYAFARFRFPGRDLLFLLVLGALLVPSQVTMIPNYLLVSNLGWLNSYQGLVFPQLTHAMGIFLLRQHFKAFPTALIEAATLDGANRWQTLWRVIVPPTAPAIAAISITLFLFGWNEYLWPLLVATDKSMLLVQVAIQQFSSLEGGTQWGPLMAAATLASLPPFLVYLLVQRQIMTTFISSGVKG